MKLYVYANTNIEGDDFGPVIDIIEGQNNADCEAQFAAKWESNDYTAAYS